MQERNAGATPPGFCCPGSCSEQFTRVLGFAMGADSQGRAGARASGARARVNPLPLEELPPGRAGKTPGSRYPGLRGRQLRAREAEPGRQEA